MNVHYLQGRAQSSWQEELDFVYAGAFFNHSKTTDLFVIAGSGHSHWRSVCVCVFKKKKKANK